MSEDRDRKLRKPEPVAGKDAATRIWLASHLGPSMRRYTDMAIAGERLTKLGSAYGEEKILLPPPPERELAGRSRSAMSCTRTGCAGRSACGRTRSRIRGSSARPG